MTVKEAVRPAAGAIGRHKPETAEGNGMPDTVAAPNEAPVFAITSAKLLGVFGLFLTILASGFLYLVVWDEIDKHLDKIDDRVAALGVTQGKFEQFLVTDLPGILQDLRRNTDASIKLESNVNSLTQSVAQVQRQVSIAVDEIGKLKERGSTRKSSLDAPEGSDTAKQ